MQILNYNNNNCAPIIITHKNLLPLLKLSKLEPDIDFKIKRVKWGLNRIKHLKMKLMILVYNI